MVEHSINPVMELKVQIAYAEKKMREERKAAKILAPKYKKAFNAVKQLEISLFSHERSFKAWEKKRDEFMNSLLTITSNKPCEQQATGN